MRSPIKWMNVLVGFFCLILVVVGLLLLARYLVKTKGKSVVLREDDPTMIETTNLATEPKFPVSFLDQDTLAVTQEMLTQSEFLTFSALFKEVLNYKLPVCNDLNGWHHYCYCITGVCFKTIRDELEQYNKEDDENSTRDLILDKIFSADITLAYIKYAMRDSSLTFDKNFVMHPKTPPGDRNTGLLSKEVLRLSIPITLA